jgi:hypothetical protein
MAGHLGRHALALAVVLVGLQVLVGTDGLVSADEGAMLAQLDLVEQDRDWSAANPEPSVDPGMDALPLELSDRSVTGRWAPFAKHPVHIAALSPLWSAGGYGGTLSASVLGVVAAAVASALLARRLRPGTEVVALWATGLGSPLVFDGFQVVGHALGAGLVGLATVAVLAAMSASDRFRAQALGLAGVVAMGAAALVRSEAVLAALALAAAVGVLGRSSRRRSAALAVALVAVAVAVRLGEPRLVVAALGDDLAAAPAGEGSGAGLLASRWNAFQVTVLDAGYGVDAGEGLLLVAVALAVAAALSWRLRGDARLVAVLTVASVAAAVGRAVTADFLVPGLLMALPVLAVALASLRAEHLRAEPARILWATVALYVGAVAATQYETGGTGEWGGRYYAVALPLLVAVSVHTLGEVGSTMPSPTRRLVAAGLAAVSLTLTVGAVRATDRARAASSATAVAVIAAVDGLDVDATVSARGAVSRFAWEDVLDGRRWLTTTDDERLVAVGEALAADGVDRVALVISASADPDGVLGPGWRVTPGHEVRPGTVVALATRG